MLNVFARAADGEIGAEPERGVGHRRRHGAQEPPAGGVAGVHDPRGEAGHRAEVACADR